MRTVTTCIAVLAVAAVLAWTEPGAGAEPGLSYAGSPLLADVVIPDAASAFTARTGIPFRRVGREGSGVGLAMVARGEAMMAGVARSLTEAEKAWPIVHYIVGYRALVVAVHADNRVSALSQAQLKGVFTGKIRNWKAVGGADAPIVVVTPKTSVEAGVMLAFQRRVMLSGPYPTDRLETDDGPGQATTLRANPHGVTVIAATYLGPEMKVVKIDGRLPERAQVQSGLYPLSEPLVFVLARHHDRSARRFVEFLLGPEGQRIVDRHFVRIGA